MKHSKKPWKIVYDPEGVQGIRNHDGYICMFTKVSKYDNQGQRYDDELNEQKANAHLMKAAPDLLEACYSSCELCQMMYSGKPNCEPCIIGEAVKKAEGK